MANKDEYKIKFPGATSARKICRCSVVWYTVIHTCVLRHIYWQ